MPQTVPLRQYSFHPEPVRYPRTDALNRHDFGLVYETRPPGEAFSVGAGRQVHLVHVGGDQVVLFAKEAKPKGSNLVQHPTLVRNTGWQHPVERADPVRAHQEQPVAEVIDITDFSTTDWQTGKRRLQHDGSAHVRTLTFLLGNIRYPEQYIPHAGSSGTSWSPGFNRKSRQTPPNGGTPTAHSQPRAV